MKIQVTILLQFLLLSIMNGQDWKEYRSTAANFSVMVPGPMLLKEYKVDTGIGETEVWTYFYNAAEEDAPENYLYMVTTYSFPYLMQDSTDGEILDSIFTDNVNRSIKDLYAELLYAEDVTEFGVPAKLWKLSYDKGIAKFKCFVLDDRFYLLQVYTTKENSLNTAVNRFMQSFRTLN